jgi:DNA-binding transcriptional MerR regulator
MRKYSIGEISEMTGLSRRTIRYYLQRGLIPPPLGAGRGRYYTKSHLARLKMIINLQTGGMFLDEIARQLDLDRPGGLEVPESSLGRRESNHLLKMKLGAPQSGSFGTVRDKAKQQILGDRTGKTESWVKVSIADGVELNVRSDRMTMFDGSLDEIAAAIERALTKIEDNGPQSGPEKGGKDEN